MQTCATIEQIHNELGNLLLMIGLIALVVVCLAVMMLSPGSRQ